MTTHHHMGTSLKGALRWALAALRSPTFLSLLAVGAVA